MSVAAAPPSGGAVASAPPGGGAVAAAITPWWPELDPTTLDAIAESYRSWGTHLGAAADVSEAVYRPLFGEVLQGQAGDALQTSLTANVNGMRDDATWYNSAAAAVSEAASILRDHLQPELSGIINYYQSLYDNAINHHDPTKAQQWLADAEGAAQAAATSAAYSLYSTLSDAFGTAPVDTTGNGGGGGGIETVGYNPGGVQPVSFPGTGLPGGLGTGGVGSGPGMGGVPVGSGGAPAGSGGASAGSGGVPVGSGGAPTGSGGAPTGSGGAPTGSGGTSGSSSGTPAGSGSAPAGSGGGPAGSSGTLADSAGASSTSSAPVSSGMPTPVMSGVPRSGSTPGRGSTDQPQGPGTTPAQDNSGMATSGAVPSPVQPVPLFGGHTPSGFAPGTAGGGGWAPLTDGGSGVDSGSAGSGGVGVGGGGMMATSPAPGGQLAPYSPPGAGSSSIPPAQAPGAPLGAASAGAAAGGVAPVIAASRANKSIGAASASRDNPDLSSAQRVLAGLVKACEARPIFWAVSVLQTPVGPQTLIAGSVGGGAYLPPGVRVPSTLQLAVLDPALPSDWAAAWMGWQSPLAILVDHYERLAKVVAGVTVSAMVTSELWPSAPECGGDFLAVRHEELVMSTEPPLVGGHRLMATDPALAARLTALDRGGDISTFVAAQLTRAIWTAGTQPDSTGLPVAVKEDADILGLVAEGAAGQEHWDNYRRDVERRADGAVVMPEIHAPRDADNSPASVTARMWYGHYYATGRIAEMVAWWATRPVSILDIAYCGIAAGFGAVIVAVVSELEKQLANPPGPVGGV